MRYYTVRLSNLDDYSIAFEKNTKDYAEAYQMYSMLKDGLQKGYYLHMDVTDGNYHNVEYSTSRNNK